MNHLKFNVFIKRKIDGTQEITQITQENAVGASNTIYSNAFILLPPPKNDLNLLPGVFIQHV